MTEYPQSVFSDTTNIHGRRWTPEITAEFKHDWNIGQHAEWMAERYDMNTGSVYRKRIQLGCAARRPILRIGGGTMAVTPIQEIEAERRRQIDEEGWTPEHDDQHTKGQLGLAACMYAAVASWPRFEFEQSPWWDMWPWDLKWWKPSTPRRNLVKAGALIVAEIERLDRLGAGARK